MFNLNIRPMLLKEVPMPFNDPNYLYELKYDGYRTIIYVSKNYIRIESRNGNIITDKYPELLNIKNIVGDNNVIFDGEIIYVENGKPNFNKLQKGLHPIVFIVFDILYENKLLINKPLKERKKILNKYPDTDNFIKSKVYDNGINLFKSVSKLDLEGIVAKKLDSLYYSKVRTQEWLKIKNYKYEYFFVHGIIFNQIKTTLLLGEYKNKLFYYVGSITTTNKELIKELQNTPKTNNKFYNLQKEAIYIKPTKKVLVGFIMRNESNILREAHLKF